MVIERVIIITITITANVYTEWKKDQKSIIVLHMLRACWVFSGHKSLCCVYGKAEQSYRPYFVIYCCFSPSFRLPQQLSTSILLRHTLLLEIWVSNTYTHIKCVAAWARVLNEWSDKTPPFLFFVKYYQVIVRGLCKSWITPKRMNEVGSGLHQSIFFFFFNW